MPVALIRSVSVKRLISKNEFWDKWRVYVALDPSGSNSKGTLNVVKIVHESEKFLRSDRVTRDMYWATARGLADAWNADPFYTDMERLIVNAWMLTNDMKQVRRIRNTYAREMSRAASE